MTVAGKLGPRNGAVTDSRLAAGAARGTVAERGGSGATCGGSRRWQCGRSELRTRTWMPAMVPWRATDDGFVTPDVIAWYERLARGKPGALVVEATGIRDVKSGPLLRIGDDRFVPGLATSCGGGARGERGARPSSTSSSSTSSPSAGARRRTRFSGGTWPSMLDCVHGPRHSCAMIPSRRPTRCRRPCTPRRRAG
jgi:hypothetical protein